ncbi:MAG: hypothetical protein HOE54_02465, partial [Gammaproteobacteria bacterium]|nr:hypothetical protein [Gammaproteobacteria bacterium]
MDVRNERVQAIITHAVSAFEGLTEDRWLELASPSWRSPLRMLEIMQGWRSWLRGPISVETIRWSDNRSVTRLIDVSGRSWDLVVTIEPEPPYCISSIGLGVTPPPGCEVRDATSADGAALETIELGSPIETHGGSKIIDRSGEIIDRYKMMNDAIVVIAFVDGHPVACSGGAVKSAVVNGRETRLGYLGHSRVLPDYQRQGIHSLLLARVGESLNPKVDAVYGILDPKNEKMKKGLADKMPRPYAWRVVIDCNAVQVDTPAVETVTAEQSDNIAMLLNRSHERDLFWSPYSVESLRERLTRVPHRYGWDRLLRTEHSMVGLWGGQERWSFSDGTGTRVRGQVLDYAVLPGYEKE